MVRVIEDNFFVGDGIDCFDLATGRVKKGILGTVCQTADNLLQCTKEEEGGVTVYESKEKKKETLLIDVPLWQLTISVRTN